MTHTATDFERTIPELLARNATEFGSLPALSEGTGEDARTLSWSQLRAQVAGVSLGLREIGLAPGDRLMIMSSSRIEHWVVDMAAVHARAVPCTAYATLSTEQIRYVARHSAASVLVLEGADQLQRWRDVFDELPALRRVVVLEESALPNDDDRFIGWQQLLGSGAARHAGDPEAFESTWRLIRPRDPVAMIYTSGTTGDPKGVVLSHRNVISEAVLVREVQQPPEHPEVVSYLPLAHIAGRELDIYMATIYGGHVHICQDTSAVLAALTAVRPPLFFGVPRVWEKITAGIQGVLAGAPEERRAAFEQASSLASEAYRLRASRAEVPGELADRVAAADERVLAPIRAMLGLDRIVSASSGAAPIPLEVLEFLVGIGVEILEVWGMSETTGVATTNTKTDFRIGTVGKPLAGVDVTLAADGEIFVRGPMVFLGYLRDDGSIAPATDADGWLATGDIGTIDEDGFLTITDRKKELIITSSGKNVPPTKLENLLKSHPLIGNAAVIGDRRPYLTALLVPDEDTLPGWAKRHGITADGMAELVCRPEVIEELARAVRAANAQLARAEQIKRYHIVAGSWTPDGGEVTPTLKLRRRIISDRYREIIDSLYAAE